MATRAGFAVRSELRPPPPPDEGAPGAADLLPRCPQDQSIARCAQFPVPCPYVPTFPRSPASDPLTTPPGTPPLTARAAIQGAQDRDDVALASRGDTAAFERLYRRHVARVHGLARWLLGEDEVDDAVQEVFIRVWQKLDTFAGQSAFSTWLHRVAVNLILRRRQASGTRRVRFRDEEALEHPVAAPASRPDLRVAIERAVDLLPAGAREVFVLHDMEGYRHEEIGGMLGVDPGTSRSQLHRARMLLRRHLAD